MRTQTEHLYVALYLTVYAERDRQRGGWGVHGFMCNSEEPKRGTGNPKAKVSTTGYMTPSIVVDEKSGARAHGPIPTGLVPGTVLEYVDIFGGLLDLKNDLALWGSAYLASINYILECGCKEAKIYLKRHPAVSVFKGSIKEWKSRGWMTEAGKPVTHHHLWEELADRLKEITDRGIKISFDLEKWTDDTKLLDIGFRTAAKVSTLGLAFGENDAAPATVEISQPQGYWKSDVEDEREDIFNLFKKLILVSNVDWVDDDGIGLFFGTTRANEDDIYGRKNGEATYCLVKTDKVDSTLKYLCDRAHRLDERGRKLPYIVHIDRTLASTPYSMLSKYGDSALRVSPTGDLMLPDLNVAIERVNPPNLIWRTFDQLDGLKELLKVGSSSESCVGNIVITDITNQLYEDIEQGKKTVKVIRRLRKEIRPGLDEVGIDTRVPLPAGGDPVVKKETYYVGVDIPPRNPLSRIAASVRTVKALTWVASENMYRYAVFFDTDNGQFVWRPTDSNYRFLPGRGGRQKR